MALTSMTPSWSSGEHPTQAKVNWANYYVRTIACDMGLIDPKNALTTLMCKWVLLMMELNDFSLKILLRYKLIKCRPF